MPGPIHEQLKDFAEKEYLSTKKGIVHDIKKYGSAFLKLTGATSKTDLGLQVTAKVLSQAAGVGANMIPAPVVGTIVGIIADKAITEGMKKIDAKLKKRKISKLNKNLETSYDLKDNAAIKDKLQDFEKHVGQFSSAISAYNTSAAALLDQINKAQKGKIEPETLLGQIVEFYIHLHRVTWKYAKVAGDAYDIQAVAQKMNEQCDLALEAMDKHITAMDTVIATLFSEEKK